MLHIKDDNKKSVTLNNTNAKRIAKQDPVLSIETCGHTLFIDELNRAFSILSGI